MMKRFEKLNELNEDLNKVLECVKQENNSLKKTIETKRDTKFEQFILDMNEIMEVCKQFRIRPKINTGIGAYGELYDEQNCVFFVPSVRSDSYSGDNSSFLIEHWFDSGRKGYCEGSFSLKSVSLNEIKNKFGYNQKDAYSHLIKIIDNWDYAYGYMINQLEMAIEKNMNEKAKRATDTYSLLTTTLQGIK